MWFALTVILMTITNVTSNENGNTNFNLLDGKNDNEKITIRKCCIFNKTEENNSKNINTTEEFDLPIYKEDNINEKINKMNIAEVFNLEISNPNCSNTYSESNVKLLENGSLLVEVSKEKYVNYNPGDYCIDTIMSNETQINAMVYLPQATRQGHLKLNSTYMLISCFFIVLTIIVYACLPINLHAMILMSYLSSFLVGFLFLAIMNLVGLYTAQCVIFTFIIYFSLLSAFFWLNVMCFDIWRTFGGRRPMIGGPSLVRSKFITYSMYAFGVPAMLTALLAILQFSLNQESSTLLPRLHIQKCFISGNSKVLYLYGPILILCLANLTFFVLTARKIALTQQAIERGLQKTERTRLCLYIKLFIVMGVNWILEVVSNFFPKAVNIWQFTDAYNLLVGLLIFVIFVCKKKTLYSLRNRYRASRGLPPIDRTHTSSNTFVSGRTISQSREEEGMLAIISKK